MTMMRIGQERRAAGASLTALALIFGATSMPAAAQQSETPTPAPSSGRPIDFRLPPADEGRTPGVQGPSDNGLPPVAPGERRGVPAPQPAPPRVTPTQPATPARPATTTPTPAPAPTRRETPTAASRSAADSQPVAPEQTATPVDDAPASSAPVTAAPDPSPSPPPTAPVDDVAAPPVSAASHDGTPIWAWLLAALAALGAGLWYWRRRPVTAGEAPAEYIPPVQPETPAAAPRSAAPAPAAAPASAPARPAPQPVAPVPAPDRTPSPLVTRPMDEQRALVAMTLEIRDIRMTADQVIVALALNLANQGPVAATGLMVRIALGQGSSMPEAVLARFFDGAGGSVLRDDIAIEPGAGEQVSAEVVLPRATIEPLMIAGRPMLVPVAAFDVTYHWDGPGDAFGQNAGSFVLGREQGASGSEKLAPLPLDRAAHRVDRPGVRATAIRRAQ